MAETLSAISIISFIAAGVFAVIAIAIWFIFKIPSIMGDLSGRTARKSIERMRQNNEKTGVKSYKTSEKNLERGKLTGTIENISKNTQEMVETGLLNENMAKVYDFRATGLLIDEDETGLLVDEAKTVALADEPVKTQRKASTVTIKLLEEVMYIHTEEVV